MKDELESENVFIGIVGGSTSDAVCIAILNNTQKTLIAESFFLEEMPQHEYLTETADGIEFIETLDLSPVTAFLAENVPQGSSVRVLIEAPQLISLRKAGETPAAVFTQKSILFKLLCSISSISYQGFGLCFAYYEVPELESIVVHYVTPQSAKSTQIYAQPRFLAKNIAKTFTELLFDIDPSFEQSAATAALIAKNHGAYYFWSTFGQPLSSGDIMGCLESGTTRTRVSAASEIFVMRFRRTGEGLEEIPLEFALAQKRWEHLGENDAGKAALVHVSKLFDFEIRCYSTRIDATGRDPRLVYPLPPEDNWAATSIKSNGWRNRK